jgi:HAMP domain-containing protein
LGVLKDRFIEAYPRIPNATLVDKFKALEDRLRTAVDNRNEFLHASWAVSPDGWIQRERRPRDRPVEHMVKMKLEHIERAAEEIGAVAAALGDLRDELVQAMGGDLPPQSGEVRGGVVHPHTDVFEDWTKE